MPITSTPYTAVYGPLSVAGATCQLWLDAADTTQLVFSSGTNVNTWRDKSGFGNSCSNITAGTTITYPGTQVNGLNTVNFTAGCIRGAFNGTSSNTGTDVTIFIVTSETAPNNNIRIFSLTGAGSYRDDLADQMLVYGAVGGYLVGYYRGGVYSTTYSVTQNVPFLYTVTQTSGIGSQYFNGGSNTTASITTSAFAVTNYNIGTQYLANQNYTGLMCEVVVYKNLLGDTQRQQIEGYLAQKWGLTANLPPGHPGLTQTFYNSKVYLSRVPLTPLPIYQNFNPKQLTGCQLWLDGADSATISGNVTSVKDKANNVTFTATGTVTTSTIGTTQSLNFAGAGYLSGSVNSLLVGTSFIVFNATSTNTAANPYFPFFTWRDSAGQLHFPAFGYVPGGVIAPYTTYIGVGTPTTAVTIGNTYLTSYSWSGTTTAVGFNGATPTSGTQPSFTSTETVMWIAHDSQAQTLAANIGEILIYNTILSAAQRQAIEGYLAWKWGLQVNLPANHPFKNVPPGLPWQASLTSGLTRLPPIVATGGTITFSGAFKIHTFTTVGSTNFTVRAVNEGVSVQLLVVGGGGGGGVNCAGGGGAGGAIFVTSQTVTSGSYSIVVGAGGSGGINLSAPLYGALGSNGGNSTGLGYTGIGGGGGGYSPQSGQNQSVKNGLAGGCGGGGAAGASGGSPLQAGGFAGGNAAFGDVGGGGGGGMGSVGSNGSGNIAGSGGNGATYTIGGTAYTLAGGGGGGSAGGSTTSSGGSGGGGAGAQVNNTSGSNATYYGSGGGGDRKSVV
jgi:hypothetical protein